MRTINACSVSNTTTICFICIVHSFLSPCVFFRIVFCCCFCAHSHQTQYLSSSRFISFSLSPRHATHIQCKSDVLSRSRSYVCIAFPSLLSLSFAFSKCVCLCLLCVFRVKNIFILALLQHGECSDIVTIYGRIA